MSQRPTIMDVAAAAGVSSATVSRVVNGVASVDRDLARRVRAAVRTTGYVPNALGRSLRRGGTAQIAVVTPDAENPYFTQIISEVERIVRADHYSVTVAHTEDDLDLERDCFAQLVGRHVAGVLLVPVHGARTDLSPLTDAGIPRGARGPLDRRRRDGPGRDRQHRGGQAGRPASPRARLPRPGGAHRAPPICAPPRSASSAISPRGASWESRPRTP